ncbi:response regulator transcription factor [Acanthopleuribacter pedis]|uniref:Response regulator transcription factor n=1 Tax=Acanthopleuribacter pedis TaxID=442870 RepID=A0A8J7QBT9_9BACT|nr:response regulator transcription factor [Acanthopleuribacter pedis]MBO1320824.1 response regulator transcription factor [Acanthopleuribacter pedis]
MAELVLVEDDERMGKLLCFFLEGKGFRVHWEKNGPMGVSAIQTREPDLVILDLMLPGFDGMEVCRRVRPGYSGPILMLTASQADANEVGALNLGIDDYLTKPFRKQVLEARLRALLRRAAATPNKEPAPSDIVVGDLTMVVGRREVTLAGTRLNLTNAEYELLWFLARRPGQLITREEIYAALIGAQYQHFDRAVDMRISALRKKLDDTRAPYRFIKTVRGKGYLFGSTP